MADTIQVVRVERTDDDGLDGVDFVTADDVAYQIVGADVIELTEERLWWCRYFGMIASQGEMCDQGSASGSHDHAEAGCSWVLIREPVDG